MPIFDDPLADAAEASAALRGLAHATRTFASPAEIREVITYWQGRVDAERAAADRAAGRPNRTRYYVGFRRA